MLRVGYVGRLAHADKRVLDLIGLVERLRSAGLSFKLTIAGDGPDGSTLQAALGTSDHSSDIRFLGWQTHEALYQDVLPQLDCLLNFSPTEGVTIAPREGLVHGIVPVLSRFPGLAAEGVFRHIVADTLDVEIDSAGTHSYHVGQPPDDRAIAAGQRRGFDIGSLRARMRSGTSMRAVRFLMSQSKSILVKTGSW